jgi:hypothetical protein
MAGIETRVARIAEATLAEQQFVTPIDILIGLGWLAQPNVDRWQRGLVTSLDLCVGVDNVQTITVMPKSSHDSRMSSRPGPADSGKGQSWGSNSRSSKRETRRLPPARGQNRAPVVDGALHLC